MRKDYARFVELSNKGAQELGFADTGAMWRAKYDMPPDEFTKELDRLWDQVRPLYLQLHAYVRMKLREKYGDVVPGQRPDPRAPARQHLGAGLVEHLSAGRARERRRRLLADRDPQAPQDRRRSTWCRSASASTRRSVSRRSRRRSGSARCSSRPRDREVVCHASAWDIDYEDDLRIKMCIEQTAEDFTTIHHELGHNFYQRAYKDQPVIFRDSANDGFHEAIGDTIALSVTPEYLVKIGLLDKAPDASRDIGLLLSRALEKVAFLPFGLLIDQWRWKVFSGEITPDEYNKAWWDLRLKYQGIAPPTPRGEEFFDPGAKYHVPANMPYTRYFLADILQFQFHRALVEDRRLHDAAASLLDLREQGSRQAAERDARDGTVASRGRTRSRR